MPILSGQIVTAADLNHLKPTTYAAQATSALDGVVVDADVPGATITFDTETDNAVYVAHMSFGADWTGAAAGTFIRGKLAVDGSIQAREAQVRQAAGAANDRLHPATTLRGTLAVAGSHTLKLVGTIGDADQHITITHTGLVVVIYEVV